MKKSVIILVLVFIIVVAGIGVIVPNIDTIKEKIGIDAKNEDDENASSQIDEQTKSQIENVIDEYSIAYNNFDSDGVLNTIDSVAACAWEKTGEDGLSEFKEALDDVTDEETEEFNENMESTVEQLKTFSNIYFDNTYKCWFDSIENIEEIGNDGILKVTVSAGISYSIDGEEEKEESTSYFYFYNGKIIDVTSE